MDWSAIVTTTITGLLAAIASIVGSYLANEKKRREEATEDAVKEQKQNDRLESIERKLDIHNGYAEKLGSVEKSIGGLDKSVALMQKDIEYLKKEKI